MLLLGLWSTFAGSLVAQTPKLGRGVSIALPPPVRAAEGFDAAASAGLFVGIRDFDDEGFTEVPFAVDDAVDLASLFVFELRLIPAENVVLALGGEPRNPSSKKQLEALLDAGAEQKPARFPELYNYLDEQRRLSGENGLFVVSAATHGFNEEGSDFLLASNSIHRLVTDTGIKLSRVFADVARARAPRRLVLLDACRERLGAARAGGAEASSAMSKSFVEAIAQASGQVVLFGSTLGGYAYDDQTRQNGVFTAAVIGVARVSPSTVVEGKNSGWPVSDWPDVALTLACVARLSTSPSAVVRT